MRIIKGIAALGCFAVGLLFGIWAAGLLPGNDAIHFAWLGPALIAGGLMGIGVRFFLAKRLVKLSKKARVGILAALVLIPVAGVLVLEFQIRNASHSLQQQAKEFLSRPAPGVTMADADGLVGSHSVGPHVDALAESRDIIERYARNGRIRWSAMIDGQFALVGFEISACKDAAGNDKEALLYVADCDALLRKIDAMGYWHFVEDMIELRFKIPEFEEEAAPIADGMSAEDHRRLAEGFLEILYGPIAKDLKVSPDPRLPEAERYVLNASEVDLNDPRVPEVIRRLHPVSVSITREGVSLLRQKKPEHYDLDRTPAYSDGTPIKAGTWFLHVYGTGYATRDVLKIEHDPTSQSTSN